MAQDAALGLTVLFAAMLAARLQFAPGRGRLPWLTLGVMALLALALAAQLAWPGLLPRFERDATAIRHGQSFRLFTALWFQDGGLRGGLYNLAMLGIVGASAEQYWDRRMWPILYFGAGLAIEVLALWWQPIGAGNSIAVFGLAGGILALTRVRKPAIYALRAIGLGAALMLAWQRDIHGAAALLGAMVGLLCSRSSWATNQNPTKEFSPQGKPPEGWADQALGSGGVGGGIAFRTIIAGGTIKTGRVHQQGADRETQALRDIGMLPTVRVRARPFSLTGANIVRLPRRKVGHRQISY